MSHRKRHKLGRLTIKQKKLHSENKRFFRKDSRQKKSPGKGYLPPQGSVAIKDSLDKLD